MISATEMKCALLHYFRFRRKGIAATEVSLMDTADVLAQVNSQYWEIGIVESIINLQADVMVRKYKNIKYPPLMKPQMFLFCLPVELINVNTIEILEDIYPIEYGLLGYDQNHKLWQDRIKLIKRAKLLSEGDLPTNILSHIISARAVAELAELYRNLME